MSPKTAASVVGGRSYGPRSMLTSAVGKDLCRPTPFLWNFKRPLRRSPWIVQQRACFNTLFNYIYKVSLNVPVRQPRSSAARRAFVALSCWQRTHKTPQSFCDTSNSSLFFSLLHACWIFHIYITNWDGHARPGAAYTTARAQSLRPCSSYTILSASKLADLGHFPAWFLIKAKVDFCCQLRNQDCNGVPKVPASISPPFLLLLLGSD